MLQSYEEIRQALLISLEHNAVWLYVTIALFLPLFIIMAVYRKIIKWWVWLYVIGLMFVCVWRNQTHKTELVESLNEVTAKIEESKESNK